jgi:hypothetical protein
MEEMRGAEKLKEKRKKYGFGKRGPWQVILSPC